jgi:small subunit ribosomal protein S4
MGDPKKHRKKYSTPMHPWQKSRIEEEREITKTYGTKNKKEIWKMNAVITKLANEAKAVAGLKGEEYQKHKSTVLGRAKKLGLIKEGQEIDDVLGLTLRDVMERRLQTLVFNKGLALSIKQARQFVTHEHIQINGRKITSPSYVVPVSEEDHIGFAFNSPFSHPEHPEREKAVEKSKKPQEKKEKKKSKKSQEEATEKAPVELPEKTEGTSLVEEEAKQESAEEKQD